jgi:hypothetical protein
MTHFSLTNTEILSDMMILFHTCLFPSAEWLKSVYGRRKIRSVYSF